MHPGSVCEEQPSGRSGGAMEPVPGPGARWLPLLPLLLLLLPALGLGPRQAGAEETDWVRLPSKCEGEGGRAGPAGAPGGRSGCGAGPGTPGGRGAGLGAPGARTPARTHRCHRAAGAEADGMQGWGRGRGRAGCSGASERPASEAKTRPGKSRKRGRSANPAPRPGLGN